MKIDAEQQFKPTQNAVRAILEAYDLHLISFNPAQSGIENCTLFVAADKGEYVLRVYRRAKKSDEEIVTELNFIEYLEMHGIPVAPAIANAAGERVTHYDGWQAILMRKIDGTHATLYTPRLVHNLSVVQANMHHLVLSYTATPTVQPLNFLQDTIFLPHVNTAALGDEARVLLERAADYTVVLPDDLPTGLCHLDYDIDNILVNEHEEVSAVLDFDDLSLAPFAVCLSYTLWDIVSQENQRLAKDYLAAYSVLRKPTDTELKLIPQIMLFRHYMIAALVALDGGMDTETAQKYTRVEGTILNWVSD